MYNHIKIHKSEPFFAYLNLCVPSPRSDPSESSFVPFSDITTNITILLSLTSHERDHPVILVFWLSSFIQDSVFEIHACNFMYEFVNKCYSCVDYQKLNYLPVSGHCFWFVGNMNKSATRKQVFY